MVLYLARYKLCLKRQERIIFKSPTAEALYHHAYRIYRLPNKVLASICGLIDRKGRKTNAVEVVHVLSSSVNLSRGQSACIKNENEMATHIPTATEISANGLSDWSVENQFLCAHGQPFLHVIREGLT